MTIRNLNEYRNFFGEIVYIYVHIPIHYFYMSYTLLLHYFTVYIYTWYYYMCFPRVQFDSFDFGFHHSFFGH